MQLKPTCKQFLGALGKLKLFYDLPSKDLRQIFKGRYWYVMYEVLLALYLTCILMIQFTWLDEILSKIESMYISKDWTFEKEFINFNDFQGSAYFESIEWFWSDIEAHTRRIIEKLAALVKNMAMRWAPSWSWP